MDDKVVQQEIVQDNPFPGGEVVVDTQNEGTKETLTQTTTNEKKFPVKRTATELLSTALNTKSRRILQEFQLQQSGGLKIGDFQEGISGDLRVTPNGLTARDIAGITTFAIDGATGSAVFKGEIRGGSIISEAEIEGGTLNINNNFTVDEEGNVTIGVPADSATGISPSLKVYNDEGALVGEIDGDTTLVGYWKMVNNALGYSTFIESPWDTGNYNNADIYIAKINVDDGILLGKSKPFTLAGVGAGDLVDAPASNQATLFINQSGGKNRLMVRFPTGASQQIAIEP